MAFQLSKLKKSISSRPRPIPSKYCLFNYSSIAPLFDSTQSELLKAHLITVSVSGALLKVAAGNQGNMVLETG
jgi:hypothetical protein